ncbi:3-alpha-hydroxysteroid dehydrogenase/carbonyl reductase [Paraburkholderia unamae]|uniref:SDR family oxidoreductase n=1 Tax=Paraburkholderia unamae TaxID=219649 RepID=UPI001CACC340|nr:SDR family oxidoreductase [Paraburkholderia unamae]CAG9243659.1 3-alpha-hydroxysteroid dehydrogenase/carbonyl reductase [Paraburkholderia unamae]
MPVTAISGAASGIGAATAAMLEAAGHRVIGIDLRASTISADLSTAAGRAHAVAATLDACGGALDSLVLCAGLGSDFTPATKIASVNYFGAVDLLDGLLPALSARAASGGRPAAVVVSSVASTQITWEKNPLAAALSAHDEEAVAATLAALGDRAGHGAYAGSKNALTVAVRQRVKQWADAGVRLNAVAPGAVETPLLQRGLDDPRFGQLIRDFVAPIPRRAAPGEIAGLIGFLLGDQAAYIHGAQLVIDGGIDALARPTAF